MKENFVIAIDLNEGITAERKENRLKVNGPKGEVERKFLHPRVNFVLEPGKIKLEAIKATKREKTIIKTFAAHIKNMVQGVQEPHVYKLKICSGHFPMNVSVANNEFIVKNFLGESIPRRVTLLSGADVQVKGTEILVSGVDKEAVGQMAGRIEQLCRITNKDLRIFQDGCYITHKSKLSR